MGQDSKIEWTDHTFNPWIGCAHRQIDGEPHPGCEHCYAEAMMAGRWKKVNWGPAGTRIMTSPANWAKPLAWNKAAEKAGVRARVFCASLADVFEDWQGSILSHRVIHDPACPENGNQESEFHPGLWHRDDIGICEAGDTTPGLIRGERLATMDDLRRKLFQLIDATPWLDWQLLTKRPENIRRMWPRHIDGGDNPKLWSVELGERDGDRGSIPRHLRNVWLGTSVSNQKTADRLIPELRASRELCPVLFVSYEPATGPVDIHRIPEMASRHKARGLDWWICGGESGPDARPMHPDWARTIRDQCQEVGVPFFFKQWGEWLPISEMPDAGEYLYRSNRKAREGQRQSDVDDVYGRRCTVETTTIRGDGTFGKGLEAFESRNGLLAYQTFRVGKKAAGRMLDGREWSEFPRVAEGAAL